MIMAGKVSNNILIIFLMGIVIFTVWEYVVAVLLEKLFKTKYWDYSNIKFNFQGRVCLKNSIYWGILAVLLIFVIQPVIERFTEKIPNEMILYLNIIFILAITVDMGFTIFRIMFIDKKIRKIFEIGDSIKEKLTEIKSAEGVYKENLQKAISDLKTRQDILKFKIYKRVIRLKKAFPEMHSENLAKFMKQKITLESIKEKIEKAKKHKK